jgi:hypothetical protein
MFITFIIDHNITFPQLSMFLTHLSYRKGKNSETWYIDLSGNNHVITTIKHMEQKSVKDWMSQTCNDHTFFLLFRELLRPLNFGNVLLIAMVNSHAIARSEFINSYMPNTVAELAAKHRGPICLACTEIHVIVVLRLAFVLVQLRRKNWRLHNNWIISFPFKEFRNGFLFNHFI